MSSCPAPILAEQLWICKFCSHKHEGAKLLYLTCALCGTQRPQRSTAAGQALQPLGRTVAGVKRTRSCEVEINAAPCGDKEHISWQCSVGDSFTVNPSVTLVTGPVVSSTDLATPSPTEPPASNRTNTRTTSTVASARPDGGAADRAKAVSATNISAPHVSLKLIKPQLCSRTRNLADVLVRLPNDPVMIDGIRVSDDALTGAVPARVVRNVLPSKLADDLLRALMQDSEAAGTQWTRGEWVVFGRRSVTPRSTAMYDLVGDGSAGTDPEATDLATTTPDDTGGIPAPLIQRPSQCDVEDTSRGGEKCCDNRDKPLHHKLDSTAAAALNYPDATLFATSSGSGAPRRRSLSPPSELAEAAAHIEAVIADLIPTARPWRATAGLANRYNDGDDCIGMHSDFLNRVGPRPVIAGLSLGVTRKFVMERRKNKRGREENRDGNHNAATAGSVPSSAPVFAAASVHSSASQADVTAAATDVDSRITVDTNNNNNNNNSSSKINSVNNRAATATHDAHRAVIPLPHNSLIIMLEDAQESWMHGIPRQAQTRLRTHAIAGTARLSVTFRMARPEVALHVPKCKCGRPAALKASSHDRYFWMCNPAGSDARNCGFVRPAHWPRCDAIGTRILEALSARALAARKARLHISYKSGSSNSSGNSSNSSSAGGCHVDGTNMPGQDSLLPTISVSPEEICSSLLPGPNASSEAAARTYREVTDQAVQLAANGLIEIENVDKDTIRYRLPLVKSAPSVRAAGAASV